MPAKRLTLAPAAAIAAAIAATAHPAAAQDAARALFDGTLAGWTVENAADGNIGVRDGVLRVEQPAGWLRSEATYADFRLRIEFRFVTDNADSGIFVRAVGDATFGPGWPGNSYQLQLRNPLGQSPFPPVGGLFRHGRPPGETDFDPAVAAAASTGTGEWQLLEIELVGEALTAWLNGTLLTRASGISTPDGHIGIQAETGTVEFRSITLAALPGAG